MSPHVCDQISARLDHLECQNRKLKRLLLGGTVLAALVGLGAAQTAKHQPLEAERLILRDQNGQARFRLEVRDTGPVFQFLDEDGTPYASLGANPFALVLRLIGKGGRLQSGLAVQEDGIAMVCHDVSGVLQTGRNALLGTSGLFPPR